MNSKERVLATINFEPVDRPAVFPLEGTGWINRRAGYSYADTFEMSDYGAADIVQGFDDMRSDVIFCGGSAWMAWAKRPSASSISGTEGCCSTTICWAML